jgi:hypothetical protein
MPLMSATVNRNHVQVPSCNIMLKIRPIGEITDAQPYIHSNDVFSTTSLEPSRCIWLPEYSEVQVLLTKYLSDVEHFHHVVHIPTLPSILQEVYIGLNQQRHVKPGHIILLLGVLASATHCWVESDCNRGLFSTALEANNQALHWVKATENVLEVAHRTTKVSIEGIQGIIIVSFVLANIEGFSRRCRSLYSMTLFLARDIGLHRIDHPAEADAANTAEAEIGRRVWWYLCATDW